jgi:nucleotide-binding universal stress UspA family protein
MAAAESAMTHILVPLDGSPLAETILPFVEELAQRARGRLTLLYVTPVHQGVLPHLDNPGMDQMVSRDSRLAESYLSDQRRRLVAAGVDASIAVASGDPASEINRHAERTGVDLIALSTHGRSGVQAWVHGSVAEEMLHTTHTPLLLVRPADRWTATPHRIERVIVPLDGSWEAETALAVAELFAGAGRLPLVLMQCVEPLSLGFVADPSGIPFIGAQPILAAMVQEARDYLEGVAGRLRARGMTVSTEVSVGAAAPGIADYARCSPGSIVMLASHTRAGWRRALLGSVARRLARTVPTPVVVCPLPRAAARPAAADGARASDAAAAPPA